MQIEELFRGSVILPKSALANIAVAGGCLTPEMSTDFYKVNLNDIFLFMLVSGIFSAISAATGTVISEYEEAKIDPQRLPLMLAELRRLRDTRRFSEGQIARALDDLISLTYHAVDLNLPVYFVL